MAKSNNARDCLDISTVAKRLRLSARHVRRLCVEGGLRGAVRFNNKWQIPRDMVRMFREESGDRVASETQNRIGEMDPMKHKAEALKAVGEFGLLYLAQEAEIAGSLVDEIRIDEMSLEPIYYDIEVRRWELLRKALGRLEYITDGLAVLKASGLLAGLFPGGEKAGCSGTGGAGIASQKRT